MREIKFRAWDKKIKDWILKTSFYIDGIGFYYWMGIDNKFKMLNEEQRENIEIIQFTGLKDKNGKEIYEGDIIIWFDDGINKKAEVIWKDCGWCAKRIDKEFNEFEKYYQFSHFIPVEINRNGKIDFFDGEVIGNIYENPELLSNSSPPVRTQSLQDCPKEKND